MLQYSAQALRDAVHMYGKNLHPTPSHEEDCHLVMAFISGLTDCHQLKSAEILAAVADHLAFGAPLAPATDEQAG